MSSSVSEDATDSGLYRIDVTYQYDFAGSYYSSSRYSFSPSSATSGYRWKKRIADRLVRGKTTFCYVNPDDPHDAVIERGVTWDMVFCGAFATICFVVFLIVSWH